MGGGGPPGFGTLLRFWWNQLSGPFGASPYATHSGPPPVAPGLGHPNLDLLEGFCRQILEWPAQPLNWAAYTLTVLRPNPTQGERRLVWAESYAEFRRGLAQLARPAHP